MDTPVKPYQLTRFQSGSIREVFHIAFPLMLAALSVNLMMFCDRVILARYSLEAMNAAAIANMSMALFQFGVIAIASIAEVFVGQHNGAKRYHKLAEPVWQMIWLSVASFIIFIPLAFFSGKWVIPTHYQTLGLTYYKIITLFSPIMALNAAISAFFIGQGKTKLVMYLTIVANLINLGLDIILIFGVHNLLRPMGVPGAAIATTIAECVQFLVLILIFLNKKNRHYFFTGRFYFNLKVLLQCIRIGAPNSVGHMIEIAAWTFLLNMMAYVSTAHVTVVAIGSNIYVLFAFVTDGLEKSITTITANYIGAGLIPMVKKVFWSGLCTLFIIIVLIAIPLLFFPNLVVDIFLNKSQHIQNINAIQHYLNIALLGVWLFFIFDGIVWVIAGILTAAGDTLFIMVANASCAWLFAILPISIVVVHYGASPGWIWFIISTYSMINCLLFYLRYHYGKWHQRKMIG